MQLGASADAVGVVELGVMVVLDGDVISVDPAEATELIFSHSLLIAADADAHLSGVS